MIWFDTRTEIIGIAQQNKSISICQNIDDKN